MADKEAGKERSKEEQMAYMFNEARKTFDFFLNLEEPFQAEVEGNLTTYFEVNTSDYNLILDALETDQLDFVESREGWLTSRIGKNRVATEPFLNNEGEVNVFLYTTIPEENKTLESELIIRNYKSKSIPGKTVWELKLVRGIYINRQRLPEIKSSRNLPSLILRHEEDSPFGYYIERNVERTTYKERGVLKTRTATIDTSFMCRGK